MAGRPGRCCGRAGRILEKGCPRWTGARAGTGTLGPARVAPGIEKGWTPVGGRGPGGVWRSREERLRWLCRPAALFPAAPISGDGRRVQATFPYSTSVPQAPPRPQDTDIALVITTPPDPGPSDSVPRMAEARTSRPARIGHRRRFGVGSCQSPRWRINSTSRAGASAEGMSFSTISRPTKRATFPSPQPT